MELSKATACATATACKASIADLFLKHDTPLSLAFFASWMAVCTLFSAVLISLLSLSMLDIAPSMLFIRVADCSSVGTKSLFNFAILLLAKF